MRITYGSIVGLTMAVVRRRLCLRVAVNQRRIKRGVGVILSVGLARAFQVSGDTARRHWLQVNNLHLEDDPAWKAD